MKELKTKFKDFLNYLHYWKISHINNVYPYKLIGQKFGSVVEAPIIIIKVNGIYQLQEVPLPKIICNLNIIEKFNPLDALKMGKIAFNDTVNSLPAEQRRQKFLDVSKAMTSLIYDVSYKLINTYSHYQESDNSFLLSYPELNLNNTYLYKLIDVKSSDKTPENIIILCKIFSRREGHEIVLENLIAGLLSIWSIYVEEFTGEYQ
jgi:hypothetical protein